MQHKRVHLLCALLHAITLFISSGLTTAVVIGEVASECAAEDKCLSPSVRDEDKFAVDTTAAWLRAGKPCLDAMSKSRVRLGDVPATSGLLVQPLQECGNRRKIISWHAIQQRKRMETCTYQPRVYLKFEF